MIEACKEAIWLSRLMGDLGVTIGTLLLHNDSMNAIHLARNPIFHAKTKHIEVKYHFIREVLEDTWPKLLKMHTDDNPAHLLMKGLPSKRFAC